VGKIQNVSPAALIAGVTFSEEIILAEAMGKAENIFGAIAIKSPVFDFDMTNYYEKEMGTKLKKVFYCFEKPIELQNLPDIKIATNEIELEYTSGDIDEPKRKINIDPGYVTLSKLILATTKDYSHRVYIGKGIFAETTLRFVNNTFAPFETTYPDYKTPLAISFFNDVRSFVKENIKKWSI
jgi:hypothetical protein